LYVAIDSLVASVVAFTDWVPRKARLVSTLTVPLFWFAVQAPLGGVPAAKASKSSQNRDDWQTAPSLPDVSNATPPGSSGFAVVDFSSDEQPRTPAMTRPP
jgi:hypothetical protein